MTIVPNPQRHSRKVFGDVAILSTASRSLADFVYDNRQEILVGTVVVAVGAAVIMTGGAAAPALAVGSDRRLKRNITIEVSCGIPNALMSRDDTISHGVMARLQLG